MHVKAVEEALDHDDGVAAVNGAMEIEKDERLMKAGGKPVFGFGVSKAPASIRNKNTVLVVDRDDDPPLHAASSGKESDPKVHGGLRADATLGEVRVVEIDAFECKGKWRVVLDSEGIIGLSCRR